MLACKKSKNIAQPIPLPSDTVQNDPSENDEDTVVVKEPNDTVSTDPPGEDTVVVVPPPPPPPPPPGYSQYPVYKALSDNIGGLYEAFPPGYDSFPSKKYPLLIYLHGGGERGDGNTELPRLSYNGVSRLINRGKFPTSFTVNNEEFSFVVISPQVKTEKWPFPADIDKVVEYALKNYRVDPTRVYIVGMSMGGGAAWEYAQLYSKKIAAIVPICGASWPQPLNVQRLAATNLPIWAFHNSDDFVVLYNQTTKVFYDGVKNINASFPIHVTLWETGGHDAWTRATDPDYREQGKNIYEWLLGFQNLSATSR